MPAFSQQTWWRAYGGWANDEGESVRQTSDGGYLVVGYTVSFGGGDYDVYLVKTNAFGDTLWTRAYGGSGRDWVSSAQQTPDGGYVIAGFTSSIGAGGGDVWLIKTDASGDTIWTKTYGGGDFDYANSVQQTLDGGFIIGGGSRSFSSGGDLDFYLIKTDASGDTLWTRTYGGTGNDWGCSVQQTSDTGYIFTGYTNSFGAGEYDVFLVKTNPSGDTLWTRTYGGAGDDEGCQVQQTSDGGYLVGGYSNSFGHGYYDVYLIKTDASGDTLWTRTYGGSDNDYGESARQTSDGGYIVAGMTNSYGNGYSDVYLIKTNAAGDTLWTQTYGGSTSDVAYWVQQAQDGGYIVTGGTYSFGAGYEDVYLIKTDSLGNEGVEDSPRREARASGYGVFPNPFVSFAAIPGHSTERFALYDISGRKVGVYKGDRIGEGLSAGVYFLRAEKRGRKPLRIVKLR